MPCSFRLPFIDIVANVSFNIPVKSTLSLLPIFTVALLFSSNVICFVSVWLLFTIVMFASNFVLFDNLFTTTSYCFDVPSSAVIFTTIWFISSGVVTFDFCFSNSATESFMLTFANLLFAIASTSTDFVAYFLFT